MGVLTLSDSTKAKEYYSKYFLEQNKTVGQYLDRITALYLCGRVKTDIGGFYSWFKPLSGPKRYFPFKIELTSRNGGFFMGKVDASLLEKSVVI